MNYYWNYQIGKEKQKYLYLQLQDLLMEMNEHQIYDVQEIFRVFNKVSEVFDQDFKVLKENIEKELSKQKEDQYLTNVKDQLKLNSSISNSNTNKISSNQSNESQSSKKPILNKRDQLKLKMKAELQQKYITKKISTQQIQNKTQTQTKIQKNLQQLSSSPQNELHFQSIQQQKQASDKVNKIQKDESKVGNTQKNNQISKILWKSLSFSPSFNYNMLMYYVLVLQNVIRSQTQLLKDKKFYEVYEKAVQNFIFNSKLGQLLQNNELNNKQTINKVYDKIEREIHFLQTLRKSAMISSVNPNSESIDPHKLLTYLINYRHQITTDQKIKEVNEGEVQYKKRDQIDLRMKELLINYKKLIDGKQNKSNKELRTFNQTFEGKQDENKLIQMAIKNKPFINSLKNLYLQSKQVQKLEQQKQKPNSKGRNKDEGKRKDKKDEGKTKCDQKDHPTYKIIDSIFNIIDGWYQRQLNVSAAK